MPAYFGCVQEMQNRATVAFVTLELARHASKATQSNRWNMMELLEKPAENKTAVMTFENGMSQNVRARKNFGTAEPRTSTSSRRIQTQCLIALPSIV